MCDPATITAVTASISAVAALSAGAISTVSAIQQGKSQQEMYNYQAEVNRNNAKIAEQNAAQERQSGLEEARQQRVKTLQQIGSQQVAFAGNGIDITSGTALDTIEDTAQYGELDALMTQYNAERTALNYEQQANNFNNQANLDKYASANAAKAGRLNGLAAGFGGIASAADGLGNIGKVSGKWGSWKNKGTMQTSNYIKGNTIYETSYSL